MQLFRRYNIFIKISNLFFAHENIKKQASNVVAHNWPQTFFFHKYGPAAQNSLELIFHIINMSQDSSVSFSVVLGAGLGLAYQTSIDFDCTKQFRTKSIPRKKHIYFPLAIIRCKLGRKVEKSIRFNEVSEKENIMLKSRNMYCKNGF
jgi:hypothetical protein